MLIILLPDTKVSKRTLYTTALLRDSVRTQNRWKTWARKQEGGGAGAEGMRPPFRASFLPQTWSLGLWMPAPGRLESIPT